MNKRVNINRAQSIFCMLVVCGVVACDNQASPQTQVPEPVVNNAVTIEEQEPAVLRETISQEIADTQTAIDEAWQAQASLESEIELMRQLLDDTEKDLRAREAEVARLEALNKVQ
jgi:septal ring factor EnvC (AmiA/AmiB activator)